MMMARANWRALCGKTACNAAPSRRCRCQSSGRVKVMEEGKTVVAEELICITPWQVGLKQCLDYRQQKSRTSGFFAWRLDMHYAVAARLLSLSFTALSQYCALNGLLMRKASGVTSTILSVGIFSSGSKASSASCASATTACFARSAWPACAERATEKNRSTGTEFCDRPSNQPHRGRCPAAARAFLCQNGRWSESAPAPPQTRAAGQICAQGP